MSGGYKTLEAGKRYLKNVAPLSEDPQEGLTQEDLDAAEVTAKDTIDAALAGVYQTAGWSDSPPPMIADIADRLASAKALAMKFGRDGRTASYIELLEDLARRDLERLRSGELALMDASGGLVVSLVRRRPVAGWEE